MKPPPPVTSAAATGSDEELGVGLELCLRAEQVVPREQLAHLADREHVGGRAELDIERLVLELALQLGQHRRDHEVRAALERPERLLLGDEDLVELLAR